MKRILYGILIALTATLSFTPVATATTANDFTISSFESDYHLGTDVDGRSTLKIVEKITAVFSDLNRNHGLERAIPTRYDSHTTSLAIVSVTDESGAKLEYKTSTSNGNEVLRIGDANEYVHGENTYVITYTQRDVTRHFADTNKDEFYWDINGTEWAVPIESLRATFHLSESIALRLTPDQACYQGSAGSTDRCQLTKEGDVITTSAYDLRPGQNVTVAFGFETGTFVGYTMTPFERVLAAVLMVWVRLVVLTSIAAIVCMIWIGRRYKNQTSRSGDIGTIVPEYLPPKGYSTMVSAQIAGGLPATFSAAIVDFAVRHYVKIYQTKEKSFFKSAEYELELVRIDDKLAKEERALLAALFPDLALGSRFALVSLSGDFKLGKVIDTVMVKTVTADILGLYELRAKNPEHIKWFKRAGLIMLIVGLVTLSPLLLIASLMAYIYATIYARLTDKGLDLQRYLAGLKLYISVAEVERIKMLQSPEGAQKVGASVGGDQAQLVKLYERVLPYAILFGLEKEWNTQLGAHYEANGTQPDWYSGSGVFNAIAFSAAMSSFTSSASSYQSSSSSTSGGSGGGGSSGGGGGGGGGGGW